MKIFTDTSYYTPEGISIQNETRKYIEAYVKKIIDAHPGIDLRHLELMINESVSEAFMLRRICIC